MARLNPFMLGLLILAGPQLSASARLDETFEQCQTRYGLLVRVDSSVRPDYPQYRFQKDGIEVSVRFLNSKSAQETFTDVQGKLSDIMVAQLLNANAAQSTWSATEVGHAKAYVRADGKATAEYIRGKGKSNGQSLVIETTEFTQIFKGRGSGF